MSISVEINHNQLDVNGSKTVTFKHNILFLVRLQIYKYYAKTNTSHFVSNILCTKEKTSYLCPQEASRAV